MKSQHQHSKSSRLAKYNYKQAMPQGVLCSRLVGQAILDLDNDYCHYDTTYLSVDETQTGLK